ncbi:MAG: DUF1501 domain-containing protein [Pirellulaceae bacterium]
MSTQKPNGGKMTGCGGDPMLGLRGIPLTRRSLLQGGLVAATGFWLVDHLRAPARAEPVLAKAKAIIQIWLWGGPPHLDTFDPKPELGNDYCGPLRSTAATNVPGIAIGELLPLLAKQADKYVLIRSTTHGQNGHETAAYMVQTGNPTGGKLVFPHAGAVVSKLKGYEAGYEGLIPPYVVLTEPQGRFSEVGFLGPRYKPFATGGDPNQPRFLVEGVVAPGISDERQRGRRELLTGLNSLARASAGSEQMEAVQKCEAEAYDLILGDAGKVFDLSTESDELRTKYGRTTFGQSCLMARRLIEKGVRFITINYGGWDTHKENFQAMRQMLPQLDKGLSSLLEDLASHGLLDSTIVWCGGEFGRTPQVQWEAPWNGGRNHFGAVFSTLLAGGGFQGGAVVGQSDAKASEVKDRPVYPWDLIGSMYAQMGIDPKSNIPHPQGMEVPLLPKASDGVEVGGRLKEIM